MPDDGGDDPETDDLQSGTERSRSRESAVDAVSDTPPRDGADASGDTSVGAGPDPSAADSGRNADEESGDAGHAEFDARVGYAREAIERGTHHIDPELLLEYTTDRRSLDPLVRVQWAVWTTIGVIILSLILTTIINALGGPPEAGALVFLGLLVLGMAWVIQRYRRWVFQIREDAIYLERGVLTHRRTLVPYVRIQHVDTSRSPLERALGLSTLVVYTAGSRGADVSIPGLTPEEARDLQGRVKELAIEAEGGDAL